MRMEILHREDLPLGGFAGLTEKRLVVDPRMWESLGSWSGIGSLVYLADANFQPYGQTNMHPHKEVDVISIMVDGRIAHEGSLEHGRNIDTNQVQVQRAGGEGFLHNEVNPDSVPNRMIQLWVLPETPGEPAGYRCYDLELGQLTRIYGGSAGQTNTFGSRTVLEVGRLKQNQKVSKAGAFLVYMTRGSGSLNGAAVKDGDLVRGAGLEFSATGDDTQIIIATMEEA
jgi:redox-sensitive bicupin YhaK (pirin superfamily)